MKTLLKYIIPLASALMLSTAAMADSERWYLMTGTDEFDKPMGFYHDRTVTDAETGIITTEVSLRARVNLFFFKIKVDQITTIQRDSDGILSVSGDFNRGGKEFKINGKREGDKLVIDVNKDGDDYRYSHALADIQTSDLALMFPVDIAALKAAGTITRKSLMPEEENLADFVTTYKQHKKVKTPDGRRELHVLEQNDGREDQELRVDDNGVVQVLIGKRRAIVLSDQKTVEAWAAKNP